MYIPWTEGWHLCFLCCFFSAFRIQFRVCRRNYKALVSSLPASPTTLILSSLMQLQRFSFSSDFLSPFLPPFLCLGCPHYWEHPFQPQIFLEPSHPSVLRNVISKKKKQTKKRYFFREVFPKIHFAYFSVSPFLHFSCTSVFCDCLCNIYLLLNLLVHIPGTQWSFVE